MFSFITAVFLSQSSSYQVFLHHYLLSFLHHHLLSSFFSFIHIFFLLIFCLICIFFSSFYPISFLPRTVFSLFLSSFLFPFFFILLCFFFTLFCSFSFFFPSLSSNLFHLPPSFLYTFIFPYLHFSRFICTPPHTHTFFPLLPRREIQAPLRTLSIFADFQMLSFDVNQGGAKGRLKKHRPKVNRTPTNRKGTPALIINACCGKVG